MQRKDKDGEVFDAKDGFAQRGWRLVAEYRDGVKGASGASIRLMGMDDAYMKANGYQAPTT
ncbi:hypothetical protein ACU4GG_40970 [Streptomyces nojiriensis]